jgi:hypothetical protein
MRTQRIAAGGWSIGSHAKKPSLDATVANHSLTLSAVGSVDTGKRLSDGEDGVGT